MTTDLVQATLSEAEARSLTDEVKQDAERLWRKLVELYDGKAHVTLGYSSWGDYFEAEFGGTRSKAYQLLSAGRVMRELAPVSDLRLNHEQARELAPLLDEPDALREAWAEASANGTPTAAEVRDVVARHRPVLTIPINEELLERQQRETAIGVIDRAVYALEGPTDGVAPVLDRLLVSGDAGPLRPSRFDRAAAYAAAFAAELRKRGIDG